MNRVTIIIEDEKSITKMQAEVWCPLESIMFDSQRMPSIPHVDPHEPSSPGEQDFRMQIPWVENIQWEHTQK